MVIKTVKKVLIISYIRYSWSYKKNISKLININIQKNNWRTLERFGYVLPWTGTKIGIFDYLPTPSCRRSFWTIPYFVRSPNGNVRKEMEREMRNLMESWLLLIVFPIKCNYTFLTSNKRRRLSRLTVAWYWRRRRPSNFAHFTVILLFLPKNTCRLDPQIVCLSVSSSPATRQSLATALHFWSFDPPRHNWSE